MNSNNVDTYSNELYRISTCTSKGTAFVIVVKAGPCNVMGHSRRLLATGKSSSHAATNELRFRVDRSRRKKFMDYQLAMAGELSACAVVDAIPRHSSYIIACNHLLPFETNTFTPIHADGEELYVVFRATMQ